MNKNLVLIPTLLTLIISTSCNQSTKSTVSRLESGNCQTSDLGGIANGASVTAYQNNSVPFNSTCVSEIRACNDGVLSGSYTHPTCTVAPATVSKKFTKDNIGIVTSHPRTYLSKEDLDERIALCHGDEADSRCAGFFQTLILTPVNGAAANTTLGYKDVFAYKALGTPAMRARALASVNKLIDDMLTASSFQVDGGDVLLAIDIMWPEITREYKLKFLEAIQKNSYFGSNSHLNTRTRVYGYHSAYSAHRQLAASLIVWDDPIMIDPVVLANPGVYLKWSPEDYIYSAHVQSGLTGSWTIHENYLAGDPTYNTALVGGYPGGLYDHFGYDNSEESYSSVIFYILKSATRQDYHLNSLRDKHKGFFWQAMRIPHSGHMVGLWGTLSSPHANKMKHVHLMARLYKDSRLKSFSSEAYNEGSVYDQDRYDFILYYDFKNEITPQGPEDLPQGMYFNGGGFVVSRTDTSRNSAFAVFISGEHISRRYGDTNSFIIHRKSLVTGPSGGRYRFSAINDIHHDYAKYSISNNILKVCDPNERVDFSSTGGILTAGTGKLIHPANNFCGQYEEFVVRASDGTTTGRRPEFSLPNYLNMGDIRRFETIPNLFTYGLGEGQDNYSQKLREFDRSFVHLYPSTFIIFDRVLTNDENFKTSILFKTFDGLVAGRPADSTGEGVEVWNNETEFVMNNGLDKASFQALLPKNRVTKIRGGTTYLLKNQELDAGVSRTINYNFSTNRYLEISAYDPADLTTLTGTSITIHGDSETQDGDSETVTFTGGAKEKFVVYSERQGERTSTSLKSSVPETWVTDMWKGWAVLKGPAGVNQNTVIQSNNENTLFGDFAVTGHWQFQIYKFHANTSKKWKRVTSVTSNKELHGFDLSFSAFFDTEAANGSVATFMPQTDTVSDSYRRTMYTTKNVNVGTHTIEIFSSDVSTRHNFFNVIKIKDPSESITVSVLTEGPLFSGTVVDGIHAAFANTAIFNSGTTTIDLKGQMITKTILFDLALSSPYYVRLHNGNLEISSSNNGGVLHTSSANGVLIFDH